MIIHLLPSQAPIAQKYLQVLATGKAKQPEAFHFNCASAYTNMQKFDKAIEEVEAPSLSAPLRHHDDTPTRHYLTLHPHTSLQYNTCIKLSPGHQQALLRRSAILHKTHKFADALVRGVVCWESKTDRRKMLCVHGAN